MKFTFVHLSDSQLAKLSDISADLGIVVVASVVLPTILETHTHISVTFTGIALTLLFWIISIVLLKT